MANTILSNIQLQKGEIKMTMMMGEAAPPYYKKETIEEIIDKIAKLDVKINEQFILREQYVEDLKKAIEAQNTVKEQS